MDAPRRKKKSAKDKKSSVRTKFLIESLRNEYYALREENEKLRTMVRINLPDDAARAILAECYDPNAPKVGVNDVDNLASSMAGSGLDDDDDDE